MAGGGVAVVPSANGARSVGAETPGSRRGAMARRSLQLLLLAASAHWMPAPCSAQMTQADVALRHKLFNQGYSRFDPPAAGTSVEVQFALNQFIEISTKLQTLRMHGWWRFYWTDPRLKWDPEKWNETAQLVVPLSQIWAPDIVVYETVAVSDIGPQLITVYPSGLCQWLSQKVLSTGCPMELSNFPFDTQRCNFTVGSNSYDSSVIDVRPRAVSAGNWIEETGDAIVPLAPAQGVDISNFRSNQEFLLLQVLTLARPVKYGCCPNPYPVLIIEFTLMRQALTYVYGMIVPLILATTVSILVLIMPAPVSGSRPGLNISTMFTVAAIYITASNKLPDAGQWSLIGRLYIAAFMTCLCMTVISVVATAVNLLKTESKGKLDLFRSLFLHHDKDKSGRLEEQEARNALACLNVPARADQNKVLAECNMDHKSRFTISDWASIGEKATASSVPMNQSIINGLLKTLVDPPKPMGKDNNYDDTSESEDEDYTRPRRSGPNPPPGRWSAAYEYGYPAGSPTLGGMGPMDYRDGRAPAGQISADMQYGSPGTFVFDPATGMARMPPPGYQTAAVNGFRFGSAGDEGGVWVEGGGQSEGEDSDVFRRRSDAEGGIGGARPDVGPVLGEELVVVGAKFGGNEKGKKGTGPSPRQPPRSSPITMSQVDGYCVMFFFLAFWLHVVIELGLTDPRNMGTGISPQNEKLIMRQVLVDERNPLLGGPGAPCRYDNRQAFSYPDPSGGGSHNGACTSASWRLRPALVPTVLLALLAGMSMQMDRYFPQ